MINTMWKPYKYKLKEDKYYKGEIDRFVQFEIEAFSINDHIEMKYLLDFMRVGKLWITDIYPKSWAKRENKCAFFTSHEGKVMNFRMLADTSVYIYINEFNSDDEVMVISGSYEKGEDRGGMSRKLKLYDYFFTKLRKYLDFDRFNAFDKNAFFVFKKGLKLTEKEVLDAYTDFKQRKSTNE